MMPAPGDRFDLRCGGRIIGATIFAVGAAYMLVMLDRTEKVIALPHAAMLRIDWYANAGQA